MAVYKGWNAKLYKDTTEIGYAESVTVDIGINSEGYYELGDAIAPEIVAGNVEVTGTIDRAWLDTDLMTLIGLTSHGSHANLDTDFNIKISIVGQTQMLQVISAVPDTTSLDIPQDGFLTQSFDFRARDFEITA